MNSEHAWIAEFYLRCLSENRPDKLVLLEWLEEIESISSENPDARLTICGRGVARALELGEPWWAAFFGFWKGEILLFQKHDAEASLQVMAPLVVETRKPHFRAFPFRVAIQLNFLAAYFKIDPLGYAPQIRAALADPQAEWDQYESFTLIYWQIRTRFLTATGDSTAVEVAHQHFAQACHYHTTEAASTSAHYVIYALVDLLNALDRFDSDAAREQTARLAELGAELSDAEPNERLSAIFTMWRAVGARYAGDEAPAQRFYRLANQKQAALTPPRNAATVAALAFHRHHAENDALLAIYKEAIEIAEQHAHWFDAATYCAQKCELLRDLGKNWHAEAEKLRVIAGHLPSAAEWEKRIESW